MSLTVHDVFWQAGMFEGEGNVRINSPTKKNMGALIVSVVNTDMSIPLAFQKAWGGSVRYCEGDARRKPFARWTIAARQAREFLLAIWPCLFTDKYRRRVALGIWFQEQKLPANVIRWASAEERAVYFARQIAYFDEMKRLNVRGRPR